MNDPVYMNNPRRILLLFLAASLHSVPEKLFIVQILGPSTPEYQELKVDSKGKRTE